MDWEPDETVEVYEVRTEEGDEVVAGHRCGDFAVRHLFHPVDVSRPGEPRGTLPVGTWVVDHLPGKTMVFFHRSRDLASFVADNFAAHFDGFASTAAMVDAAEVAQEWVALSARAYALGIRPCSLNSWLRATRAVTELYQALVLYPATRPANVAALERVLAGLPADPEPDELRRAAAAGTE